MNSIFKIIIFFAVIFFKNSWAADSSTKAAANAEASSIAEASLNKEQKNHACSYPEPLKKALEASILKPCRQIQLEDLSQIKSLRFESAEDAADIQPVHFELMASLEELDFSNLKQLNDIPNFVYDLTSLKHLNISSTSVSSFDFKLCRLKNLESLIGHNNTYINNEAPFHTFCLRSLKVLDLSNSGIVYIDEYLYYLQNLETLNMRGNLLSAAPLAFPFLPSLKTVDFRGNNFQDESLNVLKTCVQEAGPEDMQNCTEDLKSLFECEGYHRFTYSRGAPLRRYTAMTDREFLELEVQGRHAMDPCYQSCLIRQGGFDPFIETNGFDEEGRYRGRNSLNARLLHRTINGKTVREWRLALKLIKGALTSGEGLWSFFRQRGLKDGVWFWQEKTGPAGYLVQGYRAVFNMCSFVRTWDNWIGVRDENWTADESEVFPEENIYEDFEEEEDWKCRCSEN